MPRDKPDHRALDELTERLARGDRSAFRPLYEALWPVLFAFCKRALRDEHAAQDAAQDALVKIYGRAGQYEPSRGRAVTWMMQIAAFECLTVRRRASRRREDLDHQPERACTAKSPEEIVIERDLARAVNEILAELPPGQAEAILARAFEQAPLNTSPATLRKRLQRGLLALRRAWGSRHAS